ncbi:septum formation family protein [Salinibacterium sp. NK8237]|uniref:septum formation family protein n=1 Tax=Salinibacterium sp. NK8237 TaxID=2792038 RepID=UPI0018CF9A85|nr:septum formation family protein [Salinibacterium sp. NK8237]MBH0130285.1 septum formation family protein [Salinibacterium sp. NK8237]
MTSGDNGSGASEDEQRRESSFNWGLTPTEPESPEEPTPATPQPNALEVPLPPMTPPPGTPPPSATPAVPGLLSLPPLPGEEPPAASPAVSSASASDQPDEPAVTPREPLVEPLVEPPATEAINVADLPTGAMDISDLPTAAISSADLPTVAMDAATRRQAQLPASVDQSLEGATEVMGALSLEGISAESESVEHDAVSDLFGEDKFVEYEDQALVAQVPAVISRPRVPQPPRPPIPRGQLIGLAIAGGLVAALALVALFLAGTRIAPSVTPAAVASPTPSATATAVVPVVGPIAPGTYLWNELAGGECVDPFVSAWEQEYTVIDCAQPHAAQLLTIGQFDDAASDPYPEADELTSRTAAACSSDSVIDFSAAQSFADLEIVTSFAANASDWDAGNRDYYCFATRAGDDALTASVAQPQTPSE